MSDEVASNNGLIYAGVLDGKGGARQLSWSQIDAWQPADGPLWIHLDFTQAAARQWIMRQSQVDEVAAKALVSDETRPRATNLGEATLLSLRGVNMNPGSNPEDMVSIRIWVDKYRVISVRRRALLATGEIVQSLAEGAGPRNTGAFIVSLIARLIYRTQVVINDLDDRSARSRKIRCPATTRICAARSRQSGARRSCCGATLRRNARP